MRPRHLSISVLALASLAAVAAGACGAYSSPTTPTPPPGGGSGATVMITPTGIDPATVTVAVGQQVTFVNNSQVEMTVASDPHPTDTDCPSINVVGTLQPGQSRLTASFPAARSCGFHDHDHPDDPTRKGTIRIQ